tara:strand:+ start:406 stop:546 length:141 start_codon:yes stop_codon:yes gene_type:complete
MWFNILKKKRTPFERYQKKWFKKLRHGEITKEEYDKKLKEFAPPKK